MRHVFILFDYWAYDEWTRHNLIYFDGRLQIGQIVWGLTPYGACLASFSYWRNLITLHESLIEPSENWQGGLTGRERIASDILLHEMIHQFIYQKLGHFGCGYDTKRRSTCTAHNNIEWAARGKPPRAMLGLTPNANVIRQKRVKEPGTKGKGMLTWYTPIV